MNSIYFFTFSVVIFIVSGQSIGTVKRCYNTNDTNPVETMFSTKTAYQKVKGIDESVYQIPHCTATKIWMLCRHGTRYPKNGAIKRYRKFDKLRDKIIKRHQKHPDESKLCDEDIELLRQWKWDDEIGSDEAQILTTQGWEDLKLLAQKLKRNFPHIFDGEYKSADFVFKYTVTQRTKESFEAFAAELFGKEELDRIEAESSEEHENILLRSYRACKSYLSRKALFKGEESEIKKFEDTPLFRNAVEEVACKIGLSDKIGWKEVKDIYDLCSYNQAWNVDELSPWCVAIDAEQANIFEYYYDLKYYYQSGPGAADNANVQCNTVADMLKHLDSRDGPKMIAYFTHASAIQLFLTSLKAFHDEMPLTADNFELMSNRKWKTSKLCPFTANVVAVRYDCNDGSDEPTKIKFFLNERPLTLNNCTDSDQSCHLTDLKNALKEFNIEKCDSRCE